MALQHRSGKRQPRAKSKVLRATEGASVVDGPPVPKVGLG